MALPCLELSGAVNELCVLCAQCDVGWPMRRVEIVQLMAAYLL